MRTRETTLHSVLKNSESTVTTLRTGIILGASSNFTSVLDPVFNDIANRRDTVDSLFFKTECKVVSLVLIS